MPKFRSTEYLNLTTYVQVDDEESARRVRFVDGKYETDDADVAEGLDDLPGIERIGKRESERPAAEVPSEDAADGTVEEVLERVGTDQKAIQAALAGELAKAKPRATLVTALEERAEQGE